MPPSSTMLPVAAAIGITGLIAATTGTASANVAEAAPKIDRDTLSCYDDDEPKTMSSADGVQKIRIAKKGTASAKPVTFIEVLRLAAKYNGDNDFLRYEEDLPAYKAGVKPPKSKPVESWRAVTFKEAYEQGREIARALIHLGMKERSGVAIWGFNAVPWHMAVIGTTLGGGIGTGLYTTDTPDQVKYKIEYANCAVAVVESCAHAKKILSIASELKALEAIVIWAPEGPLPTSQSIKVVSWSDMPTLAKKVADHELTKREETIQPGSVFLYTFTSGTTGLPKAALMTHDNLVFEARSLISTCHNDDDAGLFCSGQERMISYLPLSHVAGTVLDILCPVVLASISPLSYITMHYARPYDLKASTIVERFQAVKPTIFFGVPRVWEKIMEKMQQKVAANPPTGLKLKIAKWALSKSTEHQLNRQVGGNGARGYGFGIAQKLILDKVRDALGLAECKFFVSAAAPLSMEVMEYFGARGIFITEGYGMTESGGATSAGTIVCHKWGTVGFPIDGIEMMVQDTKGNAVPRATNAESPEDAAQGEICIRGRTVCAGYLANPELGDEHVKTMIKKTNEAIDERGWLHTGDMGVQTETGFFKITGRYKELIIGAGGENIAPVPIEDEIKKQCPAISNVMMVGDKRKFNVALVTLKVEGATGEVAGTNKLDMAFSKDYVGPETKTVQVACKDDTLIAHITKAITATNQNGTVTPSNAAKIQKFTIIPTEFSVEGGELTPTLKLKRTVVQKMYNDHIDAVYGSKDTYVPYPLSRL